MSHLQVSRKGHVDLLSIRCHSIEEEGVVQGTIPNCLKPVESSGKKYSKSSIVRVPLQPSHHSVQSISSLTSSSSDVDNKHLKQKLSLYFQDHLLLPQTVWRKRPLPVMKKTHLKEKRGNAENKSCHSTTGKSALNNCF